MNNTKYTLCISTVKLLSPSCSPDRKGGDNLSPPFAKLIVPLTHLFNIVLDIGRITKSGYNIFDYKPPLISVNSFANLALSKNSYFCCTYLIFHVPSFLSYIESTDDWPSRALPSVKTGGEGGIPPPSFAWRGFAACFRTAQEPAAANPADSAFVTKLAERVGFPRQASRGGVSRRVSALLKNPQRRIQPTPHLLQNWRRGWDSNPRYHY